MRQNEDGVLRRTPCSRANVSTLIYSQSRGDLQRLYLHCLLSGMDYYISAIPPEYALATSSADFKPAAMAALFQEGRRVILSDKPWRTIPPGFGPGESTLTRAGTELTHRQRGPLLPISGIWGTWIPAQHPSTDPGATAAPALDATAK